MAVYHRIVYRIFIHPIAQNCMYHAYDIACLIRSIMGSTSSYDYQRMSCSPWCQSRFTKYVVLCLRTYYNKTCATCLISQSHPYLRRDERPILTLESNIVRNRREITHDSNGCGVLVNSRNVLDYDIRCSISMKIEDDDFPPSCTGYIVPARISDTRPFKEVRRVIDAALEALEQKILHAGVVCARRVGGRSEPLVPVACSGSLLAIPQQEQ